MASPKPTLSEITDLLNENDIQAELLGDEILIPSDDGSFEVLTHTYHKLKENKKVEFFNIPSNLNVINSIIEKYPLTNWVTFCNNEEKNQTLDYINQLYTLTHNLRFHHNIRKVYFIAQTSLDEIKKELAAIEVQFGGKADDPNYTKFTASLNELQSYLIFLNATREVLPADWLANIKFDACIYCAYQSYHNGKSAPQFQDVIKDEENFNLIIQVYMEAFSKSYQQLSGEQKENLDESIRSLVAISEPKQANQFVKIVDNCFRLLCKEQKSSNLVYPSYFHIIPIFENPAMEYNQCRQSKQSSRAGQSSQSNQAEQTTNAENVEKKETQTIQPDQSVKPNDSQFQSLQESSKESKQAERSIEKQTRPSAPPIDTNDFPDPESNPVQFLMKNYDIDAQTAANLNKLLHLPNNGDSLDIYELIKKARTMN